MKYKLGIIGCGHMGRSILLGVLKTGLYQPEEVVIYSSEYKHQCGETTDIEGYPIAIVDKKTLSSDSKTIILAVKPSNYEPLLQAIRGYINEQTLLISITPAYTIRKIEKLIGPYKIAHALPNTPAFVGEAMTGISFNNQIEENDRTILLDLFSQIGKVKETKENVLKAVTCVSSSSPAITYSLIEALAQGAIVEGLNHEDAYLFAAQAVKGAAEMVLQTKEHPAVLRDHVCTPRGTTIHGVKALEKSGFKASVLKAMQAIADQFDHMQDKY